MQQLIFSADCLRKSDVGIYMTRDEITAKTGLSRSEQETARKLLKERNLISESYRQTPRKLFFTINFDVLKEAWQLHQGKTAIKPAEKRPARGAERRHQGGQLKTCKSAEMSPTIQSLPEREQKYTTELMSLDEMKKILSEASIQPIADEKLTNLIAEYGESRVKYTLETLALQRTSPNKPPIKNAYAYLEACLSKGIKAPIYFNKKSQEDITTKQPRRLHASEDVQEEGNPDMAQAKAAFLSLTKEERDRYISQARAKDTSEISLVSRHFLECMAIDFFWKEKLLA